jgi:hypothetical protein
LGVLRQICISLLSNVFSQGIAEEEKQTNTETAMKPTDCLDEEGGTDELDNQKERLMKMVIDFSLY